MRYAAYMPELQENHPAFGMDGFGDTPPPGDLFGGMDTRGRRVSLTAARNLCGLGNDQTAFACALRVINGTQFAGHITRLLGSHPGQRRHHDAVRKFEWPNLKG